MIKIAYTNIESKIEINDLLSDPLIFMLVLQGCLFSILLYNIAAEVLANSIIVDKKINPNLDGGNFTPLLVFS